jgi:hypothetical protein
MRAARPAGTVGRALADSPHFKAAPTMPDSGAMHTTIAPDDRIARAPAAPGSQAGSAAAVAAPGRRIPT